MLTFTFNTISEWYTDNWYFYSTCLDVTWSDLCCPESRNITSPISPFCWVNKWYLFELFKLPEKDSKSTKPQEFLTDSHNYNTNGVGEADINS